MATALAPTFNSLVYTRSAACRILGCAQSDIARIETWAKVIFVVFKKGVGRRPRFVSKRAFTSDFAQSRQDRARSLTATQWPNDGTRFTVRNDNSSSSKADGGVSRYTVQVQPDRLQCECRDWRDQEAAGIKNATCKHCYAVLNKLGCGSLADFIRAGQPGGKRSRLAAVLTSG